MKTTLLLDLDDTLLENDVNVFLPAYLQSFSQYVSHLIPPEIFIQSLITGTQLMMENNQPNSTLKEVFEAYFYQITGVERDEFEILADEFYASIYPELKKSMKVIPAAINLVEAAFNRGYRVVIATNPLFPKTAIDQRLSWAGLHRDRFNFELVTTYENSHFAKPNPSYFAEILGKLGWSDDRYLVVGNDLEHDIFPANVLGLPTYWIDQPEISPATELETQMARGGLGNFSAWFIALFLWLYSVWAQLPGYIWYSGKRTTIPSSASFTSIWQLRRDCSVRSGRMPSMASSIASAVPLAGSQSPSTKQ